MLIHSHTFYIINVNVNNVNNNIIINALRCENAADAVFSTSHSPNYLSPTHCSTAHANPCPIGMTRLNAPCQTFVLWPTHRSPAHVNPCPIGMRQLHALSQTLQYITNVLFMRALLLQEHTKNQRHTQPTVNNNNKRPLTLKSMPPTGDEQAKLKT